MCQEPRARGQTERRKRSVLRLCRSEPRHKHAVGMAEGRAPGFPPRSVPWLRSSPALCSAQHQAATPLGAQPGGWSWGGSPCHRGLRPPAGMEAAFRQLADNNCLRCCLLKVSPQEMVQEIHQVLMDREDTCHRTCFSLQLDGNVLDNFAELKTIEGLQEGSLLKVVEGKFLQTSGGNKQGVVLATWQRFPVVPF